MEMVSRCRLKTGSLVWQPRAGANALTILCKATFALQPGESRLAEEQDALWTLDTYADDARLSLIAASDMCPFKRRADVLFYGHAYAPSGHPSPSIVARLVVGNLDKSIEVRAENAWNPKQGYSVASFGPVAPTSPLRTARLGHHARTWDAQTWNTRPLPDDFDGAFFNAAPADQQMPDLAGDEIIALEHLSPVHPRLVTRLAKIVPRATVQREHKAAEQVRLRCDTLTVYGDRGVASLVFRGLVILSHPAEPGVITITAEGAEAAEGEDIEAYLEEDDADEDNPGTMVLMAGQLAEGAKPALPFIGGGSAAGARREVGASHAHPAATGHPRTAPLSPISTRDVLPFQSSPPERPSVVPPPVVVPLHAPVAMEPEPEFSFKAPANPETEVESRAPIHVAPPPMIGPVQMPAKPAPGESTASEAPAQPVAAAAEQATAAPAKAPAVELSIEQVATIAAEIAERRQDQAAVLEAHGVDEPGWSENQQRWTAAIEEHASRGKHAPRWAYDAAYVSRVEQFRGAIAPEEYARILLALDRGRTDEALDTLKIQRPALMPIVRLWTRRTAKDAALADMVSDALRAAQRD